MKQFKFLAVAFTLLMGISLTSCLDSNDSSTRTGWGIVKVNSSYGTPVFTMLDGTTITPSAASVSTALANGVDFSKFNGQIIQLMYSWDSSVMEVTEETKDIRDVTLQSFYPMNSTVEFVEQAGARNDSISDAPVISLRKEMSGYKYEPYFWGNTLILPIEYHINNKIHNFTLECHPDKQSTDGLLTLVLEHNKNKDQSGTLNTSWDYAVNGSLYLYYRAFDLTNIFYRAGGKPQSLVIEYMEGTDDLEYAKQTTYTIPYKDAAEK